MFSSVTNWFHSWLKHPYGTGATAVDYVATALVALLILWGIWKVIHEVRKAV